MADLRFEDILKEKAQGYKPDVPADLLANVKAASVASSAGAAGGAGTIKATFAKITSSIITKSVATIITVATVGYFVADKVSKTNTNDEREIVVETNIITNVTDIPENNIDKVSIAKKTTDDESSFVASSNSVKSDDKRESSLIDKNKEEHQFDGDISEKRTSIDGHVSYTNENNSITRSNTEEDLGKEFVDNQASDVKEELASTDGNIEANSLNEDNLEFDTNGNIKLAPTDKKQAIENSDVIKNIGTSVGQEKNIVSPENEGSKQLDLPLDKPMVTNLNDNQESIIQSSTEVKGDGGTDEILLQSAMEEQALIVNEGSEGTLKPIDKNQIDLLLEENSKINLGLDTELDQLAKQQTSKNVAIGENTEEPVRQEGNIISTENAGSTQVELLLDKSMISNLNNDSESMKRSPVETKKEGESAPNLEQKLVEGEAVYTGGGEVLRRIDESQTDLLAGENSESNLSLNKEKTLAVEQQVVENSAIGENTKQHQNEDLKAEALSLDDYKVNSTENNKNFTNELPVGEEQGESRFNDNSNTLGSKFLMESKPAPNLNLDSLEFLGLNNQLPKTSTEFIKSNTTEATSPINNQREKKTLDKKNGVKKTGIKDLLPSFGSNTNNKNRTKKLDVFNTNPEDEKLDKEKRVWIYPFINYGTSALIDKKETSRGLNEERNGSFYGGGLALHYQLSKPLELGFKFGYQKISLTNSYYSNNQQDGSIKQNIELFSLRGGGQLRLLHYKRFNYYAVSYWGVSYKLNHNNSITGKYFEQPLRADLTQKNSLSLSGDLSLKVNYQITRRFFIEAALLSEYISINKRTEVLNIGAQLGMRINF